VSIAELGFLQDPPRLGNQYGEDTALRAALKRMMPAATLSAVEPDLVHVHCSAIACVLVASLIMGFPDR